MVPVKAQGNQIICAIRDPAQVYQADGLQFVLNAEIRFALTTGSGLTNAKAEYYGVGEKVERRGAAAMAAADEEEDDDEAEDELSKVRAVGAGRARTRGASGCDEHTCRCRAARR